MTTLHETHTVWDHSIAPIHEVEPGATVELEVTDASGGQLDKDSSVDAVAALDFSNVNPVTGPVFVKGAVPGDVLEVEILALQPRDWGWTAIIPGFGLLADEFPEPWLRISSIEAGRVAFLDDVVLPFEPFPGTIGVAPAEPGEHSIVPPTRWGGNLDIKHLRVGTRLLLPVGVEGALFSVGDTHAAMGDGEVCGTAVEAPMNIAVRLDVRRDVTIAAPQYVVAPGELARTEAGGYHVCTGVGPDLMEASRDATRAAIAHIVERRGGSVQEAYALASVACDLRIHEIVDMPNWVVGCFVPDSLFEGDYMTEPAAESPRLRRELHFWEAIALSIAIMAPTAAMALNGVGIAALIGRAVPLAFLFALVGVLFVSYAFSMLSREVSHSGSVYALTGFTLGARAGFLAGWALLGTYLCFTVASSAEVGLFFSSFLASTGISDTADWIWIALVSAVLISFIAAGDIRVATRSLLTMEGISVTLIVILVVVIFAKLIGGSAPAGHESSLVDAFKLPNGTSLDAVATAAVFGFLSFAGFEGAASLGEETDEPRRNIPRALFLAPLSMGIFYFFVILAQTLGFGTNEAGVAAFAGSSSPLGELSKAYVGSGLEDAINLGATISAFASALGTATAGSRVLYALSRDSLTSSPLARVSPRSGAPLGALALVMAVGFCGLIGQRIAGTNAVNAFFYPGTIGVLSLMVAYIATNLGGIKHLFFGAVKKPIWQIVFPVLGIAFLCLTIYKNVQGAVAPYSHFPWYVLAWLVVGGLIIAAAPGVAKRVGERLTSELEAG